MNWNFNVEMRTTESLLPYVRNPRKNDHVIDRMCASIKEFGFPLPILVKDDGTIIDGHLRHKAAHKLEMKEVPCISCNGWTEAQIKAFRIVANRYPELAEWDEELLALEFKELEEMDFDVELTGYDDKEIERMIEENTPDYQGLTDPDDAPPLPEEAVTQTGDLWLLGNHRLLCGDTRNMEDVGRLMDGKKADMVFTDPPYNHASLDKGVASSVSKAHRDLMDSDWDKDFDFKSVIPSMKTITAHDCTIYICASWHLAGDIWKWMATQFNNHGYCIWHKPNPMPSLMKRHWTWASEIICYATIGKHIFNFPQSGHALNVWTIAKKSDGTHPTQKPTELIKHAIKHSSNLGNLVVDVFCGSGSTIIACEETGRECYALEIDPQYCDVIVERWQDFTGKQATLESNGKSFEEISKERA